jgi:Na+/H+ antiporter NhaD/arsenite permease-like protein
MGWDLDFPGCVSLGEVVSKPIGWVLLVWCVFAVPMAQGSGAANHGVGAGVEFPLPLSAYVEPEERLEEKLGRPLTMWETLVLRVEVDPFNLVATIVFVLAVVHTFLCARFRSWAHHFEEKHRKAQAAAGIVYPPGREPVSFRATVLHFLGEVEAVFGVWLIPLLLLALFAPHHGWGDAVGYLDSLNFTESIFVVVVMVVASSRPVIACARGGLRSVALLGKGHPAAWWLAILLVAPLLGSFITEPAAMTIAALLLGEQFFRLRPSLSLRYATLGLLFVNISVGGTLTHFAAPPVLMVAGMWHWNLPYMLTHFGWRAVLGIVIATLTYFLIFRKELLRLQYQDDGGEASATPEPKIPIWVVLTHLLFLGWVVLTLHHPSVFVLSFLFYLAFTRATEHHQDQLALRGPVLVGFFLASLVIHGGLQSWWISVVLSDLTREAVFLVATVLTAFNDNAAITYLASQVPSFRPDVLLDGDWVPRVGEDLRHAQMMEYAVVTGAVTGGGLTVIANAPNPAGQSLLQRYFGDSGIAPGGLLLGALFPTAVMAVCFLLIP